MNGLLAERAIKIASEWKNYVMAENFCCWDSADYLRNDEDMALYFEICTADDPGDGSLIRSALRAISRARGMTQLARDTGISRDGLYTALSAEGNPSFATILKITRALGLTLHGEPLVAVDAKANT